MNKRCHRSSGKWIQYNDVTYRLYRSQDLDPIPYSKNIRSRGKHEPGDGDYENRWTFADARTVFNPSYPDEVGCFFADWEYYINQSFYVHPSFHHFYWDGMVYIQVYCEDRSSGDARRKWNLWYAVYWLKDSWVTSVPCRYTSGNYIIGSDQAISPSTARSWVDSWFSIFMMYNYDNCSSCEIGTKPKATTWGGRFYDVEIVDPNLRFDPCMNYFRVRREVGDYTLRLDGALAAAYVDAVNNLPTVSGMNNIENALSLLGALKAGLGILLGDPMTTAESVSSMLKSAWLSYRYIYTTTKADLETVLNVADRMIDLLDLEAIHSNGSFHQGDFLIRCSIKIQCKALAELQEDMKARTMQLNAYNAWDMVPFSFIADWFLHVGDVLETYENRNVAMTIVPEDCWFSVERRWRNCYGNTEIYYYRFRHLNPDLSWVSRGSITPRVATWVKRGLDVIAIFG